MSCLVFLEKMSRRLDGQLPVRELQTLENHLGACEECRIQWGVLQGLDISFSNLEPIAPPPDFVLNVMLRLGEYQPDARTVRPIVPFVAFGLIGAAAILVFAFFPLLLPILGLPEEIVLPGSFVSALSTVLSLCASFWRVLSSVWSSLDDIGNQFIVVALSLFSLGLTGIWARLVFSFSNSREERQYGGL